MAIEITKTQWREVVLICKKCSKKLGGGFGPDGDKTLKKALKTYLKPSKTAGKGGGKGAAKGGKRELLIKQTGCFDVCPKNAVVAINAANPKALLIVPAGADLIEVKARLGLDDGRRTGLSLTFMDA